MTYKGGMGRGLGRRFKREGIYISIHTADSHC